MHWQRKADQTSFTTILAQIQCFESVHPNMYSIYCRLGCVEEPLWQDQTSLLHRAGARSTGWLPAWSCCCFPLSCLLCWEIESWDSGAAFRLQAQRQTPVSCGVADIGRGRVWLRDAHGACPLMPHLALGSPRLWTTAGCPR